MHEINHLYLVQIKMIITIYFYPCFAQLLCVARLLCQSLRNSENTRELILSRVAWLVF